MKVKKAEADKREQQQVRQLRRQKILRIVSEKKDQELQDKSIEELMALLDEEASLDG